MSMVLLRVLDNRFQADLWCQALTANGVPHVLRPWRDTAYDGLYEAQKGYASLYVEEEWLERARRLDQALAGQERAQLESPQALARMIDHTLLEAGAGQTELDRHLDECLQMGAGAACVLPWMTPHAAAILAGSPVAVCAVVDFPLGAGLVQSKMQEALELAEAGATELDVVINRGLIASGRLHEAVEEVAQIAAAAPQALVKVILETPQLGPELSERLADMFLDTRVAYLKTGTGFFGPATLEDVQMLKAAAGAKLGVKAAGGIRTLDQALALIAAGAGRLGASAGFAIWQEARQRQEQGGAL